jgi:hypothetical protein
MPFEQVIPSPPSRAGVGRVRNTVEATIRLEDPLTLGKPVTVQLSLRDKFTGKPLTLEGLREVHTQKIHLLIIDTSLTDYHHEHPIPVAPDSGDYVFAFTPSKPGPYRVWADLLPLSTNSQEYAVADIPAESAGEPVTDSRTNLQSDVSSLHFELTLSPEEIKPLQVITATLRIYDHEGNPFRQLEPIMGTFAHMVGFYPDRQKVIHCHPKGSALLQPQDRGGPELQFRFGAIRPGLIRLFCQVQVNGMSIFAPFSVIVAPPANPVSP